MESSYNTPAPEASAGATVTPKKSICSIIANVFLAPAQAFADFKPYPRILVPLILTVILGALMAAVPAKYNAMLQVEIMQKSTTLPPAVVEQMRQGIEDPKYVQAAILGGVLVVVIGIISALICWALGGFIMGGQKTGFKSVWGVELLAGLIPMLGGVLRAILIIIKGNAHVSFGLAALFPHMSYTSFMYLLMTFLDIFAIWSIIVAGIGFAIIFGLSRGKGIAVSAISWIIVMGAFLGLQMVGMMLAGVEVTFF